ncbi:hypothetical protein B5E56_04335 [Flavonifractor sp. An112]|nr:hypothetical protein B5E56_04335 [Flavonifractor sp. An112]
MICPAALAAESMGAGASAQVCYPTSITRSEDGTELKKIYDLGPEDDPAGIPRSDFEQDGFHYVALCGTGGQAMHWMLEQNQHLRDVVLCLDSDGPGQSAARRLQTELQEGGYHCGILLPVYKDWNEDLVAGALTASLSMTAVQSL